MWEKNKIFDGDDGEVKSRVRRGFLSLRVVFILELLFQFNYARPSCVSLHRSH